MSSPKLLWNWKEIEVLAERLRQELFATSTKTAFLKVEALLVPKRAEFTRGFLKNEWALKFRSSAIAFSLHPRLAYLTFQNDGVPAAEGYTHSPFSLGLASHLKGARLTDIQSLKKERAIELRFERGSETLRLTLFLIPAHPLAILHDSQDRVVVSNRAVSGDILAGSKNRAPENPPVRSQFSSLGAVLASVETALHEEAFEIKRLNLTQACAHAEKNARKKIEQNETALGQARAESDYSALAKKLSLARALAPKLEGLNWVFLNPYSESGEAVTERIPADPKRSLEEQVQYYFDREKRRQRKITESEARLTALRSELDRVRVRMTLIETCRSLHDLQNLETPPEAEPSNSAKKVLKKFSGKQYRSIDDFMLLAGRTLDENLELTFKVARGNDLWLHVKGRPGTHVVILIPPGKSAPLETLLDAANLAVALSGGIEWGKTEVDYTFRKHVKRIKNSKQVSYTQNKTLIVIPDLKRLERLKSSLQE